MAFLFDFLRLLCEVLTFAIIFRAILSWFSPRPTNMLAVILNKVTEPLLAPLTRKWLEEMRDIYAFLEQEFPALLERWEQEHKVGELQVR